MLDLVAGRGAISRRVGRSGSALAVDANEPSPALVAATPAIESARPQVRAVRQAKGFALVAMDSAALSVVAQLTPRALVTAGAAIEAAQEIRTVLIAFFAATGLPL